MQDTHVSVVSAEQTSPGVAELWSGDRLMLNTQAKGAR
jgi:hypothetical protein